MSTNLTGLAAHTGRPLRQIFLSLALACGLIAPVAADAGRPPPDKVEAATRTLERAMGGDKSAIDSAADQFAELLKQYPGEPLVMAFAGASTALRAQGTWMPWRKVGHAEDGLALIDKALAMLTPAHDAAGPNGTPIGLETRFVAASTFLSLPSMFNRGARGERMLNEVIASPQFATAPVSFRGAVWLRAGLKAVDDKRTADARKYFQQVADLNGPQAPAARAKLKEMGA